MNESKKQLRKAVDINKNKRLLSQIVDKRNRKSFYSYLNIKHLNI